MSGNDNLRTILSSAVQEDRCATAFLEGVVTALHVWDDLIDLDKTPVPEEINDAFWFLLVDLPRNRFYMDHFDLLNPVLMVAITNWHAANHLEREGDDNADKAIAFILRSAYVDLITQCALIVGGTEWANRVTPAIRRFAHSEGYQQYRVNLTAEVEAREGGHAKQR